MARREDRDDARGRGGRRDEVEVRRDGRLDEGVGNGLTPAWLLVGRVLKAHGVRGRILVASMTDFPERFEPGSRLWIGDDEDDLRPVEVVGSSPHKGHLLLTLTPAEGAGARDRAADPFIPSGRRLFVPIADVVDAGEGRYYHHELIGCRVETTAGDDIGVIESVIRPGPQDLLVVDGGDRGEIFVPLVESIVREVDRERRRVLIDPPGGLLDVNVAKC